MKRRFRSAITGRLVKRSTARRHPRATVAETVRPRTGRVRDVDLELAVEQLLAGASDTVGDLFIRNLAVVQLPDLRRLERIMDERRAAPGRPSPESLPLEQALVRLLERRDAAAEGPRIVVRTASRDRARIVFEELARMAGTHPELAVRSGVREVRHREARGWLRVRSDDELRGTGLEPTLEVRA